MSLRLGGDSCMSSAPRSHGMTRQRSDRPNAPLQDGTYTKSLVNFLGKLDIMEREEAGNNTNDDEEDFKDVNMESSSSPREVSL